MIEQLTQEFFDWLFNLPTLALYVTLFAIAYIENLVPPLPGDIVIVFAGYLAAEGLIMFGPTLVLTTLGSGLGFMTLFILGWFWGDEIKLKKGKFWLFKYVRLKYYARVKIWMKRWGQGVILANRFLAGTRSIISLTAGITQTRVDYTLVSTFAGALLWNSLLLWVGWTIKENWEMIGSYLDIYGYSVVLLILIIVALRWIEITYRKKFSNSK